MIIVVLYPFQKNHANTITKDNYFLEMVKSQMNDSVVISYTYDDAGCRDNRNIFVYSSKKKAKSDNEEIDIEDQEKGIILYPIPPDNFLFLQVNNDILQSTIKKISIYDELGILILQKEINQPLTSFDVGNFQKGNYIAILTYDTHQKNWKFVVK